MVIYGINPVLEALRSGRATELRLSERSAVNLHELIRVAERHHVLIRRVAPAELDRVAGGGVRHQGVVANVSDAFDYTVQDLVRPTDAAPTPLIVVLDGIEDPHNVGAIVRSVDAAGASGVVRQSRRAAALGAAAAKASAGAIAHVKIAKVVNIARSIEELKRLGVWTVGLAAGGETRYDEINYREPTAFVVGAEGSGLRRLVRERCDWIVSIPMRGQVDSLNVSVAAAIVLFEAVRQRLGKSSRTVSK
ncbi:MAG: 23S rRNA (guanosine(2251)-2'-O)-methyltransferase RlmB [Blastocatellia bacterium]|nr:MAG: 23S rRNA (guanosine(2251)-2'-O)-methyltransferase RlmB [Blastocatellia bacterium]